MPFGIRIRGPFIGFILITAILGYAAQAIVPAIVDPHAGLPDKTALLTATGVPTVVPEEGQYFTLPGGTRYFGYAYGCGFEMETFDKLQRERGPVAILYGREIHKTFRSRYAYRQVFEIQGANIARPYAECERTWIHRNRVQRYMSIPFLALLTLLWLHSVWRLAVRKQ